MSNLFDKHWQWDLHGVHDATAAGKVIRPIVRMLEKKGYNRAEILSMVMDECFHELLKISSEKAAELFVPTPTEDSNEVTYAHASEPDGQRFKQLRDDPLPLWATNIKTIGKDVHTEHCCIAHGCKYMDDDCPVYLGTKTQSYICEDCQDEPTPVVTKTEIARRIEVSKKPVDEKLFDIV
jgi:hypothetical protein